MQASILFAIVYTLQPKILRDALILDSLQLCCWSNEVIRTKINPIVVGSSAP